MPFWSLRGTNHQSRADLDEPELLTSADQPPAFGVVFIQRDSIVRHTIDIAYDGEIASATTHYDDWTKTA